MKDVEISLSKSMEETLEVENFDFLADIGEIAIDAVMSDGVLKEVPILGSLVGIGKCLRNVYDLTFAKKLIAFLFGIKDSDQRERIEAIQKWEESTKYRIRVGETLIGMIQRCDDSVKAAWLSKLFYELVLKRGYSRLFMRAEKVLSSLSVMDVQAFLALPQREYSYLSENNCEPFVGSGLYMNAIAKAPIDGNLNLDDRECKITEIGIWIYKILNGIHIPEEKDDPLF